MSNAKVLRAKVINNILSRFSDSIQFGGNSKSNYEIEPVIITFNSSNICSILFMFRVLRSSILIYILYVLIEAAELKTVFLDSIYHTYDINVYQLYFKQISLK